MAKSKFEKGLEEKLDKLEEVLDEIVVEVKDYQKGDAMFAHSDTSSTLLSIACSILEKEYRRSRMMYMDGGEHEEMPEKVRAFCFDRAFATMLWGQFGSQLSLVSKLKRSVEKEIDVVKNEYDEIHAQTIERLGKMAAEEAKERCECERCDEEDCACGCKKD